MLFESARPVGETILSNEYRADIDGLRALAVTSVVLYHCGFRAIPGGFVGVDIFFVISGYLITRQIAERLSLHPGERLSGFLLWFYERRTRRILPALSVAVSLTLLAGFVFLLPNEFVDTAAGAASSMLFVANIYFWNELTYFAPRAETLPLLHIWSLGVEEQFYILFPLLLVAIWRWRSTSAVHVLSACALVSLIASEWMVRNDPSTAFYWLPFRAWELLTGAIIAYVLPRLERPPLRPQLMVFWGLGAIAISVFLFSRLTVFPGISALVPCVGAAFVICGGAWPNRASAILSAKPLVWLGCLSFSLYLYHWPVLVYLRYFSPHLEPIGIATIAIPLSLILAYLSFKFVESPIRKRRVFVSARRLAVGASAAICMIAAGACGIVWAQGFPARLPPEAQALLGHRYEWRDAYRFRTCFLDHRQSVAEFDREACLPRDRPLALLWGDSFAAQYQEPLGRFLTMRGYAFAQATASACPPIPQFRVPIRPNCVPFNTIVDDWIGDAAPDVIFLAAHWAALQYWKDIFLTNVAKQVRRGATVVILGQGPLYRDPVPNLLARRRLVANEDSLSGADMNREVFPADEFMKRFPLPPGATFVSILDSFCPDRNCPMLRDGVLLHWDDGHLTATGSAIAVESMSATLEGLLNRKQGAPKP